MASLYVSLDELQSLAVQALIAHNTSGSNARSVAAALVAAEADGLAGQGLSCLESYCTQTQNGKVDGHAIPTLRKTASGVLRVNAKGGFAYPALFQAIEQLSEMVQFTGIAAAAVTNSHHCGSAGYHVEQLADKGLIGLMFSNTPKVIAPWGGQSPLFGINPVAFAAPRAHIAPLVIDLSLAQGTRGRIQQAAEAQNRIPEGWALDSEGNPTTDPHAAMSGAMLPIGEAKGAGLVLMVEILAAALTASQFGYEAGSFFAGSDTPSNVGQLIIAINPAPLSDGGFANRLEALLETILQQSGTRLPGSRRVAQRANARRHGIQMSQESFEELRQLGEQA